MSDDLTLSTGNATGFPASTVFATKNRSSRQFPWQGVALGDADTLNGVLDGNADVTLLASAARTAAGVSSVEATPSHRGVLFFLDVTGNAGAAKTLSLKVEVKDPVSGNWKTWADFGVLVTNATGTFLAMLYNDLTSGDLNASVIAYKRIPLPRTWRATVTPSDSTSWTYSLGACLLGGAAG